MFHLQLWRLAPYSAPVGIVWLERMGRALVSAPLGSSLMDQHAHVSSTMLFKYVCLLVCRCVSSYTTVSM